MGTMRASDDLLDELYDLKGRNESYEDVVWMLLDHYHDRDDDPEAPAPDAPDDPPVGEPDDADLDTYADDGREALLADLDTYADDGREALLADLDIPGSGDRLDARRETIGRMYDALRAEGNLTKQELLDHVDADKVGYASRESFWSNCIKGRQTLAAIAGVSAPAPGSNSAGWTFTDPES